MFFFICIIPHKEVNIMAHPFCSIACQKYNVQLAVLAQIMLLDERSYSLADCTEKVYAPTDELILQLSNSNPQELVIFCGEKYKPKAPTNKKGECIDVFLLCSNNQIAYLGTIVNASFAIAVYRFICQIKLQRLQESAKNEFQEFQQYFDNLSQSLNNNPFAISRRFLRCAIPVICEQITAKDIEKGVRKFMKTLFPNLSKKKIKWLNPTEKDLAIRDMINARSKMRVTLPPQTEECRIKVVEAEYGIE